MFKFALAGLLHILWCLMSVQALPTWEGLNSRSDFMSSLVPSATFIEVLGPQHIMTTKSHLTSHIPGEPGNLTALPAVQLRAPSLFFCIYGPTTLAISVRGSSLAGHGRGEEPCSSTSWEPVEMGGLFYTCSLEDNTSGIFMSLEQGPTPAGCHIITLHSFSERIAA
ncbi:hypothetical protein MVEN_01246900 [Mycena venus]|uniref:Uncharacterized protein n=1 Tax=Mycena venus TaxID=2733690 RepID=A0A8H6Y5Y1_9AGAR|nr:hypothetical protein MVEN_01246900 [Mycena venus]